ncbi:hydroxymethylglutaryl-CoA lyase [Allocatelliglobosispora scoriae]|uniref:Hydroxymethylglutaryl-CoA lyase n=1 Tax=Allocatelliglobosispora scoriae TaxID=643052 RepID=A0A841C0X5_9ACTN|nr:hydroxymethylglutaryl-CoA lyase [Allocatelliglobosispora scoriae]MBB5873388.1 hydroxymethylglutaryl-CoA lyase [Allocatelliglobosispora scoriae]
MEIVEVGPRDGLQNEKKLLSTATKVDYIRQAIAAGLRRIEAVAFAHPARVPQMADAEAVLAAVPRIEGVSYSGLLLNRRGLDRALASAADGFGVDEVNYVLVATDVFSSRNQGMTSAESLAQWSVIAADARAAGLRTTITIAAAFGCPFTGEVPVERVRDLVAAAAQAGPDEICLADTIGVGVPRQVAALAAAAREVAPDVTLRAHFHNTRNTGYANAIAAGDHGITVLDASTGGIGGCPFAPAATGNIATEDLAYLLKRNGQLTGVDVSALATTGRWITAELEVPTPALLGRAGPFPPEF